MPIRPQTGPGTAALGGAYGDGTLVCPGRRRRRHRPVSPRRGDGCGGRGVPGWGPAVLGIRCAGGPLCWESLSVVGGPSGPTLFGRVAASWNKSVGPEGPPTTAKPPTAAKPHSSS
ncbi:DUF6053 domain-containing protein [Lysobacter enzymogenes]|uniref:DUF6053 domain-containing protein n=1 Tax=Lysobacter enzymogenes TaxID=69 RepID=UPI003D2F93D6